MATITESEHEHFLYQSHVLAKLWEIIKPSENSDYDTNNFYDYAREGAEARRKLAEGERAVKEFVAGKVEEGSVNFDEFLDQCKSAQIEAGIYHADLESILPVLSKSPFASATHNNASVHGYILRDRAHYAKIADGILVAAGRLRRGYGELHPGIENFAQSFERAAREIKGEA